MPKESAAKRLMTVPVSVGLTFLCVVAGEVMFQAYSFHDALTVYGDMLGRHGMGQRWPMLQIVSTVAMLAVVWLMPNTQEILGEVPHDEERNWSLMPELRWRPTLGWMLTSSAAFVMSMVYSTANSTFLYFQF